MPCDIKLLHKKVVKIRKSGGWGAHVSVHPPPRVSEKTAFYESHLLLWIFPSRNDNIIAQKKNWMSNFINSHRNLVLKIHC